MTELMVLAPVGGTIVAMADIPDPVFAASMVGPGLAINPDRGRADAVAPVAGKLTKLHPHAYVVVADDGRGVLVHLGIDTVEMKGEGFELLATEGETVTAGQPMVRWDPAAVEATGRSAICPIVALDAQPDAVQGAAPAGRQLAAGDDLFTWA